MKKYIQKQLATKELSINKGVGAAELRYQVASKHVEHAEKARAGQGKPMPLPVHEKAELARMDGIANRNTDGPPLRYVYDQVKDKLLANPTPEALSRVKGCSVMARLDAAKASERLEAARRFGDFRQLPLKDARGLDYTKSNREVSPRNALETVIRHFTDSAEQKREQKDLTDAARQQLARAEEQLARPLTRRRAQPFAIGCDFRPTSSVRRKRRLCLSFAQSEIQRRAEQFIEEEKSSASRFSSADKSAAPRAFTSLQSSRAFCSITVNR